MQVTLGLSVLLVAGFLMAKIARAVRLPSVTGYLIAGIVLGPSVTGAISEEVLTSGLGHFTDIALMLIAFTIGEKLDLRELRPAAGTVGWIALGETAGSAVLVMGGMLGLGLATQIGHENWMLIHYLALAMLLGCISTATGPAATLLVFRELRASGPLTRTLMATVACNNGIAIMTFGVAASIARALSGGASDPLRALGTAGTEIVLSLLLGMATGLLLDILAHRTRSHSDLLIAGLGGLLLMGECARLLHLSPLLSGMAAGLTVVNRDRRDVRMFRAINAFDAPIYVLFFALAGAHLNLSSLRAAGLLGAAYVVTRLAGKSLGAYLGATLTDAAVSVRRYLGLALIPQAGVAIGLAFLVRDDPVLSVYSSIVLPVVLGSVVVNELLGPPAARFAAVSAGEAQEPEGAARQLEDMDSGSLQSVPWNWPKLSPPERPDGHVLISLSNPATTPGLIRIGVLLSHHYGARPLTLHVLSDHDQETDLTAHERRDIARLFHLADMQARQLGYQLDHHIEPAESVADGILDTADAHDTHAIVVGHPADAAGPAFTDVVDVIAQNTDKTIVALRYLTPIHTERILVPIRNIEEFGIVRPIVCALAAVEEHEITVLNLMSPDTREDELRQAEQQLAVDLAETYLCKDVPADFTYRAVAAEARTEAIIEAAEEHDIIVMAVGSRRGIQRLFFGCLAEDVCGRTNTPLLMVRGQSKFGDVDDCDDDA